MPLGEFELIARYFREAGAVREDVITGIGDDGAVLAVPPGMELVAVLDTLVAGVHFPTDSPPDSIGHRALAVNLSDLAAMGAEPAWALLALTLPASNEAWLQAFARGFADLARMHRVALVGGDTTSGPLCVSVQASGFVPRDTAILRSGGNAGDVLCVTGTPGDAAGGLELEWQPMPGSDEDLAYLARRFLYPDVRCEFGMKLRGFAGACIDVSDGLAADAGKLAAASGCAAEIVCEQLPLSAPLVRVFGPDRARELALSGGEDCELLFSVPASRFAGFERELPAERAGWRRIGRLRAGSGVWLVQNEVVTQFSGHGYDHFADG